MTKYLPIIIPIVVAILILIGGLIYIRSQAVQTVESEVSKQVESTLREVPQDLPSELRLENLEDENKTLKKELEDLKASLTKSSPQTQSSVLTDSRLRTLETTTAQLKADVTTVKDSVTTLSSTKNPVVYIPLGTGGSGADLDWYTLNQYQATIDPSSYPGYTSMQLEVSYKLDTSSGTGYARLYNATDGNGMGEVSTTIDQYSWVTSGTFTPASGSKVYKLQIKSATGTNLTLQSARIKVNF